MSASTSRSPADGAEPWSSAELPRTGHNAKYAIVNCGILNRAATRSSYLSTHLSIYLSIYPSIYPPTEVPRGWLHPSTQDLFLLGLTLRQSCKQCLLSEAGFLEARQLERFPSIPAAAIVIAIVRTIILVVFL